MSADGKDGTRIAPSNGTRIALACLACRQRRHRCSGTQPCTSCVKMHREDECIYAPSKRGQGTKRKAAELEADELYPPSSLDLSPDARPAGEGSSVQTPQTAKATLCDLPLDGMGVATDEHKTNAEQPFLGPSAALSFFDLVKAAILSSNPEQTPNRIDGNGPTGGPSCELVPAVTVEEMRAMPPRHEADRLLNSFMDVGQGTYPVLHEATFRQQYERTWHPPDPTHPISPSFYALLNITLAIGSVFANAGSGETKEAEAYAAKCHRILAAFSPLNNGSLVVVQCLVFMALYSQSKASPTECWNTLGLASRMALALGLHVEPPAGTFDPIVAEQRRRAWWACFCFDTIMSCTFGRPALVSAVDPTAAKPSPYPDEAKAALSRPALFTATVNLYMLLSRVISVVYGSTPDAAQLKAMLDLEAALEAWRTALPDQLHFDAPADASEPSWVLRHRIILQSRYLHIKILLFRPSLTRALSPTPTASTLQLNDAAWGAAASICLEAAHLQIAVCHRCPARNLTGNSRWYEIAYLFGACAVLLAARWRGSGLQDFDVSWEMATSILRESRPAAARTLDGLRDHLADGALFRSAPTLAGAAANSATANPSTSGATLSAFDETMLGLTGIPAPPNLGLASELEALLGNDWYWPAEALRPSLATGFQPLW